MNEKLEQESDGEVASSDTNGKQPIGWEIDFIDKEGNVIDIDHLTYAFDPSEDTHRLSVIVSRSLGLFGIEAHARVRPRGFSGSVKGKSSVLLRTGKKLEMDIFHFSALPNLSHDFERFNKSLESPTARILEF